MANPVEPGLCLHISGPPCAGKSSLTRALQNTLHLTSTMLGDPFWVENDGLPFPQRVAATNARILDVLAAARYGTTFVE